jgi:hypothetical protein
MSALQATPKSREERFFSFPEIHLCPILLPYMLTLNDFSNLGHVDG